MKIAMAQPALRQEPRWWAVVGRGDGACEVGRDDDSDGETQHCVGDHGGVGRGGGAGEVGRGEDSDGAAQRGVGGHDGSVVGRVDGVDDEP